MRVAVAAWLLLAACAPEDAPVPSVEVHLLRPATILPGTRVEVRGAGFLPGANLLRLRSAGLDLQVAADWVDARTLGATFGDVPEGAFEAEASVVREGVESRRARIALRFARRLEPRLGALDGRVAFANDPIRAEGDGFLLGGREGQSVALFEGCFRREGEDECREVSARVPAAPQDPFDRRVVVFPFSPDIAGILPGRFQGSVRMTNVHPDGTETESGARTAAYAIGPPEIREVAPEGVSLGQYLFLRGGGFLWGKDELSTVRVEGTVDGEPFSLEIVPETVSGPEARYPIEDLDGFGRMLEPRRGGRVVRALFTPVAEKGADRVEGTGTLAVIEVRPMRQVIHLRFLPEWTLALYEFGLTALDERVRARVLEVARRDYAGVGVEFREEAPRDWALWSQVDVGGEDPNGLGLLGYDNTPGKDVGNQRLWDRIGGVNALVQQDGYPGFGGVFALSFFGYRETEEGFRETFDEFVGDPVTPDQAASAPGADSGDCPSAGGRAARAACAARVLGSLVGSTLTHEVGHSLGLAVPEGPPDVYHPSTDAPGRLMDYADARPFAERAEIGGAGPGRLCDGELTYLRDILPSNEPPPDLARPACD